MIKKILLVIVVVILVAIGGGLLMLRHYYRTGELQRAVADRVVGQITQQLPAGATSTAEQGQLIKRLLGFDQPQTILVLLLNNTELRPGGGFIGSYAVVKLENGVPHVVKVEGTEVLDYSGYDSSVLPSAPDALSTYLKVPRWYFRDSNWSPDFASSAIRSLDLYRKERGVEAENITAVVGITATVLEDLLKITGPVTVSGETFTIENVLEKLQYEVEYAYVDKGIEKQNRKQILGDLVKAMVKKIGTDVFSNWKDYYALGMRLLTEKQMAIFVTDPSGQAMLRDKNWTGEVPNYPGGDYFYWVDANLGALKTDAALQREVSYTFAPSGTTYLATVAMRYRHEGERDWRTSRYMTYTRFYVPPGSQFVRAAGITKNAKGEASVLPDQGKEFGRQWYGGFATIEPGAVGTVSFTFKLAPAVASAIRQGTYNLMVQKQIGTRPYALTLNLDFGRRVLAASPGEESAELGDRRYIYRSDLRTDRMFTLKLGAP